MPSQKPLTKLKKDVKAISPLIATLLLIVITVAASVMTYSWIFGFIGSESQQAKTRVALDSVSWDLSGGNCSIIVRNIGEVGATIESIAIRYDTAGSTFYTQSLTSGNSIATGTHVSFTWTESGASAPIGFLKTLNEYVVRVTTTTGLQAEMVVTSPST